MDLTSGRMHCGVAILFALFGSIAVPFGMEAKAGPASGRADSVDTHSAGELRAAILYGSYDLHSQERVVRRRSVPLALGMSAVVPGLGQAYNDDWIKAAAAVAIEVGLVAGYVIWRSRGLNAEDAYIDYAHSYWSAGKYASWLNDYVDYLEAEHGAMIGVEPIAVPAEIDFTDPREWSAQERSRVRALFNEIRGVEEQLFHPETGASFSHKLPYFGEQQYYELIGKYFQFAPGWVDYPVWMQGSEFTQAIDPERSGSGGTKLNIQGRFLDYAEDHAKANTLLRRASRVSAAILFNHIIAAFDAAISAKLHNDRLDTNLAVEYDFSGGPSLRATARWRF